MAQLLSSGKRVVRIGKVMWPQWTTLTSQWVLVDDSVSMLLVLHVKHTSAGGPAHPLSLKDPGQQRLHFFLFSPVVREKIAVVFCTGYINAFTRKWCILFLFIFHWPGQVIWLSLALKEKGSRILQCFQKRTEIFVNISKDYMPLCPPPKCTLRLKKQDTGTWNLKIKYTYKCKQ